MVVKGSCMCGQTTYEYTGEYSDFVACHCHPCRKTTGADRSLNLVVPKASITVNAGSKERLVTRKGDSGGDLTYHECGNCGGIMYAEPEKIPVIVFLKVGLLDDHEFVKSLGQPKSHIYCKNLWGWESISEGAKVADVM